MRKVRQGVEHRTTINETKRNKRTDVVRGALTFLLFYDSSDVKQ